MKFTFNKKALAAVTAGLLGASIAGGAQADVLATSIMQMDGFQFTDANGDVLDRSDFGFLTFTGTAGSNVSLTGETSIIKTGINPPGAIDLTLSCVGSGCNAGLTENGFELLTGPASGNYSAADQFEDGAPITGITGFNAPATLENSAYVGLLEPFSGSGSANSDNNLNSSFIFSVVDPIAVTISFDATAYLEAYVDGNEGFPGDATAAYSVEFAITNLDLGGVGVFDWAPDGDPGGITGGTENDDPFTLNHSVSLNAPLPGTIKSTGGVHTLGTASTGSFSATTDVLTPGVLYQFSARNNNNADARRVEGPEPAVIALMGFGLLGLGVARRRQKKA